MTDPIHIEDLKSFDLGVVKIKATITQVSSHRIRNGNIMTEATISDKTAVTRCVWFSKYPMQGLRASREYTFIGKYQLKYGRAALQQPRFTPTGKTHTTENPISANSVQPKLHIAKTYNSKRDWSGLWAILFWAIILGGPWLYHVLNPPIQREADPSYNASPTDSVPSSTYSNGTSYYWYCWDSGDPDPHHLGHHVSGDHHCTYKELHDAGFSGY